jgi:benzodiazapine receptor
MDVPPQPAPEQRKPARGSWWSLLAWIVAINGIGVAIGMVFAPGAWFDTLRKPSWNPPDWLFAPVWTLLYTMLAVSVWLMQGADDASADDKRRATRLFLIQLAFNFAWTPLFFGLQSPVLAFVEICALWVMIVVTALEFGKVRPLAGYLLAPYAMWVAFALILNGTIALMND